MSCRSHEDDAGPAPAELQPDPPAPTVPWIAGREKALARAIAVHTTKVRGRDFATLSFSERKAAVHEAMAVVRDWIAHEVLVSFPAEYREAAGGGAPLVQWQPETARR